MKSFFTYLLILFLTMGCASSNYKNATTSERDFNTVESSNYEVTLMDFIRKLPGVTVRGSGNTLTVRVHAGGNSLMNNSEPLFLLDGTEFSGDFQALLESLNPNDIKSVSVYKNPAEVGMYGVRGVNGVINIKLK